MVQRGNGTQGGNGFKDSRDSRGQGNQDQESNSGQRYRNSGGRYSKTPTIWVAK